MRHNADDKSCYQYFRGRSDATASLGQKSLYYKALKFKQLERVQAIKYKKICFVAFVLFAHCDLKAHEHIEVRRMTLDQRGIM